jgi:CO/xanthine dehydrogenase Mo-binding subunit
MGQGYGTTECLTTSQGKILEHNYDSYIIPTTLDTPEINVNLFECEDNTGTYGAKSIGEPAMECVAAAIANAVYNATGKRIRTNPLNLETVLLGENLVR